jgi:diguanylate cyclase (GGDEF)-like protein
MGDPVVWRPQFGPWCVNFTRKAKVGYDEGVTGSDDKEGTSEKTIITDRKLAGERQGQSNLANACLVVIYGTDLGKRIPLGMGVVEAGRSTKCDLSIDQESVSRHHARIYWTGRSYRIKDLESTNGTFVNDQPVLERDLSDGDQIKIGRTILKFMTGGNIEASYHEEIYRLMTFDGLTQAYNKRYFHEALEREISRCRRYAREVSLILFDIDHFKKINDTHGHLAGDTILRDLALTVKGRIRREDVFARVGGEEFAVLLPEVPAKGAREAAEKVRRVVEATSFRFEQQVIPVTVSLGIAAWAGGDEDPQALYKRADQSLYSAKESGRNRVGT